VNVDVGFSVVGLLVIAVAIALVAGLVGLIVWAARRPSAGSALTVLGVVLGIGGALLGLLFLGFMLLVPVAHDSQRVARRAVPTAHTSPATPTAMEFVEEVADAHDSARERDGTRRFTSTSERGKTRRPNRASSAGESKSSHAVSTSVEGPELAAWGRIQFVVLGALALIACLLLALRRGGKRGLAVGAAVIVIAVVLVIPALRMRDVVHVEQQHTVTHETTVDLIADPAPSRAEELETSTPIDGEVDIAPRSDRDEWLESGRLQGPWQTHDEVPGTPTKPWLTGGATAAERSVRIGDTSFRFAPRTSDDHIIAFSGVEPSRGAALRAAHATAAQKLAVLALMHLESERPEIDTSQVWPLAVGLGVDVARAAEIDRIEQSSERAYGPIYRAAVLVDVDDQRLASLATTVESEHARGWVKRQDALRRWLWTGASVGLLAIAIFLLYTFLNAGTKGHFAWPLRFVSAAVFLILCAAVYFIRVQLDAL